MARKSRMSILKRQREQKKMEKAARKRAKRHGEVVGPTAEPEPDIRIADLFRAGDEDGSEAKASDHD